MNYFIKILLLTLSIWVLLCSSVLAQESPSEATNIRVLTDPQTKRVVITYDLPSIQPDDSLYVEIERTASKVRFRPSSVTGDVGKALAAGNNKVIYWDVVRDNIQINEDIDVIIKILRPGMTLDQLTVSRRKSALPVISWLVTGGMAIYTATLASSLNKDVDAYNQQSYANTITDWNAAEAQRKDIDSRRGTFTILAGVTAALAVTNVVWLIIRKKKQAQSRTTWNFYPGSNSVKVAFTWKF